MTTQKSPITHVRRAIAIAGLLAVCLSACQYRPDRGKAESSTAAEPSEPATTPSVKTSRDTVACPTDPGLTPCGLDATNAPPAARGGYAISTLAGSGTPRFADGAGAAASFVNPIGVVSGPDGSVYVADSGNNRIRKITKDGTVSTFAGDGKAGWADGPAGSAEFNAPRGLALSAGGTLYVADTSNHCIRAISPSGTVTTIAGSHGKPGLKNAVGTKAQMASPNQIALGKDGSLYVTEFDNHLIRLLSRDGKVVKILAGTGVRGFKDGAATKAQFDSPVGIVVDGNGVVFVSDAGNNRIRRIEKGVVTTLAGRKAEGFLDGKGEGAKFNIPYGLTADDKGNLYATEYANNSIRKITTDGVVTTIIAPPPRKPRSTASPKPSASPTPKPESLSLPAGIVWVGGRFYVSDSGHAKIRVVAKGK